MPCRAPKRILRGPRRAPNTSYGEWGDPKTFDHILWKIGTSPCAIDANQCLMQANFVRHCRYGRDLHSLRPGLKRHTPKQYDTEPIQWPPLPLGPQGSGGMEETGPPRDQVSVACQDEGLLHSCLCSVGHRLMPEGEVACVGISPRGIAGKHTRRANQ